MGVTLWRLRGIDKCENKCGKEPPRSITARSPNPETHGSCHFPTAAQSRCLLKEEGEFEQQALDLTFRKTKVLMSEPQSPQRSQSHCRRLWAALPEGRLKKRLRAAWRWRQMAGLLSLLCPFFQRFNLADTPEGNLPERPMSTKL